MSENRTATDVLLSIESKLDKLIKLSENEILTNNILSNKLTKLLSKQEVDNSPKFSAEAVDNSIMSQEPIPFVENPNFNGFSRTSRSESYANTNSTKFIPKETGIKMPVQIPRADKSVEIVIPQQALDVNKNNDKSKALKNNLTNTSDKVSVIQRVVDKNSKSVFLAEVNIINSETIEVVEKIKTNGVGKWMTHLSPGKYNVLIKKINPVTKENIEYTQQININSSSSTLELPMIILK